MCHYLGWQLGSDMPKVYVHLSGRDIDNAIYNKVYGLKIENGDKDYSINPVMCPRCKESCGPTSEYCNRCGAPLKEEKIFNMERNSIDLRKEFFDAAKEGPERIERLSEFLELLEIVDSDPEIKARLMDKVKKK